MWNVLFISCVFNYNLFELFTEYILGKKDIIYLSTDGFVKEIEGTKYVFIYNPIPIRFTDTYIV